MHVDHVGYGLVLDTGSDVLLMEARAALETVGDVPPAWRTRALLQTHVGTRAVDVEHHVGLRLANVDLPRVALVRLPADAWRMSPEVGLLPASLFSRVYVSARTGVGGRLEVAEVMPLCRMPGMPKCRKTSFAPTVANRRPHSFGVARPRTRGQRAEAIGP